jgi:hypothetical protein
MRVGDAEYASWNVIALRCLAVYITFVRSLLLVRTREW